MNGYYDALLTFLAHTTVEGFVRREYLPLIAVKETPEELLAAFARYEPCTLPKWIDVEEA